MRDVNLTNVQALKDDLNHSNWEIVFQYNEDVNAAYNSFVDLHSKSPNLTEKKQIISLDNKWYH